MKMPCACCSLFVLFSLSFNSRNTKKHLLVEQAAVQGLNTEKFMLRESWNLS